MPTDNQLDSQTTSSEKFAFLVGGKDYAFPTVIQTVDGSELETKWLFEQIIGQSRKQEKARIREELTKLQQSNHDLESALEELKSQGLPEAERQRMQAEKRAEQAEKDLAAVRSQIDRQAMESEITKAVSQHAGSLHDPEGVIEKMTRSATFETIDGERKLVVNWNEKRLTPNDFMVDFMRDERYAYHRKNTLNSGAGSTGGAATSAGASTAEGVYRRADFDGNPDVRKAAVDYYKRTGREPQIVDG